MGFWLLSSGIITVIEGVNISLNVVSNCRYVRVFKLLVYLGARAYTAVLLGALCARDLLLLEGPSCFRAAAVYKVSIEFPFGSSQDFLREEWLI